MNRRIRAVASRLVRLELGIVAILVIASLVSARLLLPAIALASAFWPVRWLADRRLSVRTPGDWAIVLLMVTIPITVWVTPLPDLTRTQVLQLLLGVLFYYAVANWMTSSIRLQQMTKGIMLASLALALVAPLTVQVLGPGLASTVLEAFQRQLPPRLSDTINPNVLAGALVLLLTFILGVLLFGWKQLRWPARLLGGGTVFCMALVLLLTGSRGALIALAVAALALIVLRWRHGWLAVPAALLAAAFIVWRSGVDRVIDSLATTQTVNGLDMRLEVWSRALYIIQDFPLTGVGMGGFRRVATLLYPFFVAGPDVDIPHAHNLFLQVGVDLGLPGLVAWLALFGLVCLAAWRVYRWGMEDEGGRKARAYMAGVGAGLLCSQIALAVHGLLDATTWGTRPAMIVWGLWGIAMATWNLQARPIEMGQSTVESRV